MLYFDMSAGFITHAVYSSNRCAVELEKVDDDTFLVTLTALFTGIEAARWTLPEKDGDFAYAIFDALAEHLTDNPDLSADMLAIKFNQ